MKNRRNYYRILQVQPDAPDEVIRASYRTLMRELKQHPDLGGSTQDASILNEAYEVLSHPERRAEYNRELSIQYARRTGSRGKPPITAVSCPFCKQSLIREPQPGDCCPTCRSILQSGKPSDITRQYERSLTRLKRDDRILFSSKWPGKPQKARMVDFSPHGMRFLCSERLVPRTVLKISSPFFEASAAVTNQREQRGESQLLYAIGVAFIAISFKEPRGTFLSTSV